MPKIKTNRGAAKRFTRSGSGKLRRRRAYANHILTKKNAKRKRRLAQGADVSPRDHAAVERLLPYR